jgi:hypothetical protein
MAKHPMAQPDEAAVAGMRRDGAVQQDVLVDRDGGPIPMVPQAKEIH